MYDFAQMKGQRVPIQRYRTGDHCPNCDGAHWHVGRLSAVCAGCDMVLPFAPVPRVPAPTEKLPEWATRA
ncbi:MAG: hypothetical protein V4808_07100 [Pseudomonadota bacterium]